MKKELLVLEGIPGTGKTTIFNNLRSEISDATFIQELAPNINPLQNQGVTVFLSNDEQKYEQFKKSPTHSIMDRGYPSTLNWDYVLKKQNKPNNYTLKFEWYKENMGNKLLKPSVYVLLEVSPEVSLRRKQLPIADYLAWSTNEGLKHAIDYYDYFFSTVESDVPVERINANREIFLVLGEVKDIYTSLTSK